MSAVRFRIFCLLVGGSLALQASAQEWPREPRPGKAFQSTETRALQEDESRNPGMLWVEQGAKEWQTTTGPFQQSCASCHGDATVQMTGVAARYPKVSAKPHVGDHNAVDVINIEDKILLCHGRMGLEEPGQQLPTYESPRLLALTAYVAYQSRGVSRKLEIYPEYQSEWRARFDHGRKLFQTRQGQMNLSCAQCHDDLVGKKLRGDTISQGQTHGWPAYRLEWQTMGSLQRRLRACSLGVRAEVLDYGHPDYLALELYLAWRGEGLPMESPGVRR
jgi:L-cysteine S-thiosulfotransferase